MRERARELEYPGDAEPVVVGARPDRSRVRIRRADPERDPMCREQDALLGMFGSRELGHNVVTVHTLGRDRHVDAEASAAQCDGLEALIARLPLERLEIETGLGEQPQGGLARYPRLEKHGL